MSSRRNDPAQLDDSQGIAKATIFGYPAGKAAIASKIVKLLPSSHETYVEPFCGSAAVFFTKDAANVEALNDLSVDVAGALKAIQKLSPKDIDKLRGKMWIGDEKRFLALRDSSPTDPLEQLYKFLYTMRFSYGYNRKSWAKSDRSGGVTSKVITKIEKHQDRLKNAKITSGDYEKVLKEYDGPNTLFFMDPPYAGYTASGGIGESDFDEARFRKCLDQLKGKFLVTCGTKGKLDTSGLEVQKIKQVRRIRSMRGTEQSKFLHQLVITNFKITAKSLGDGIELEDTMTTKRTVVNVPEQVSSRLWKNEDPFLAYPEDSSADAGGEARVRFLEKRVELDLLFDVPGSKPVAWTLEVQKSPAMGEPSSVAKSFSVHGSRFFLPLTRGVAARKMVDSIASSVVKIDSFKVEHGLQTENVHEYFLSKGDELAGVLTLEREQNLGEKEPWLATYVDAWPQVVNNPTVLKSSSPMPPAGVSALPQSLEKFVPASMRYWEMRGEEAIAARAALIVSKAFGPITLAMVDGELSCVAPAISIATPGATTPPAAADWPLQKIGTILPASIDELVEVFSPDRASLAKAAAVTKATYVDAGEASDGALELLSKSLLEGLGHYVVTAIDSPEARASLEKMGRVFRFVPGEGVPVDAAKRIFVASFPVRDAVDWIDKAVFVGQEPRIDPKHLPQIADLGNYDEHPDLGKADLTADGGAGFLVPAQGNPYKRHREKTLLDWIDSREMQVAKAAGDEHIVYGIVLEPDTVDAQNDVYSADEVRTAAHKYMEEFQNTGLMHQKHINKQAKVIESFLAPEDFSVGGQKVKKGTWVMAMRIVDPDLWKLVKDGDSLTGFSIGGHANRSPEATAKAMRELVHQGIKLKIDRPKGYVQTGRDSTGKEWTREYKVDYGYIPRTKGGDGEGLDVFMGPDPDAPLAFWITQNKADGSFDEFKLVLGADSSEEAKKIYLDHVPEKFFAGMHEMSIEHVKSLLNKEPAAPVPRQAS